MISVKDMTMEFLMSDKKESNKFIIDSHNVSTKMETYQRKFYLVVLYFHIYTQVAQLYCSTLAERCPTTACIGSSYPFFNDFGQYCPILAQQH